MAANGVDTARLSSLIRRLGQVAGNAQKEMGRVLVSAQRATQTEAKRAIAARYALPQNRIAQGLTVRARLTQLDLTLTASDRSITAAAYGGRQTRQGYRFKVLRSAAAITIARGFTAPGISAPLMRVGALRYPIKVIYGPSHAQMLSAPQVATVVVRKVTERVAGDVDRRITRAIEGAAR